MSDIDLNQPIFQEEFSCSEATSLPGTRFSQDYPVKSDSERPEPANYINLFRNSYEPTEPAQTTASKSSLPQRLNPSMVISQQLPTDHAFSINRLPEERTERLPCNSFLKAINQSQTFECLHRANMRGPCQLCKGTGFLKGSSNLIKFFEYFIGFKLGINQPYKQKKLQKRVKVQVNSFCNDFYSSSKPDQTQCIRATTFKINSRSTYASMNNHSTTMSASANITNLNMTNIKCRDSMGRMSYKSTKRCNKQQLIQEINNTITVHDDYVCDVCQSHPIVGARYHCNSCQDFDVCYSCYVNHPHQHGMDKIDKTAKNQQLENIVTLLVQPIGSSGRISLRQPPSIQHDRVTTKSAIR